MRTSILGEEHKTPEPTCINYPKTGELITRPAEIKKVTIKHKELYKQNPVREKD